MPVRDIQSAANPLLVRLRKALRDPASYRRSGELWLEGQHLCEAWTALGRPVVSMVVTPAMLALPWVEMLRSGIDDVVCVPETLFAGISSLESPAGIGLLVAAPSVAAPSAAVPRPGRPTLVLDRVQDPGNVGTLLRTAAAMGLTQVVALAGTAALWSPKVLRGGMGAHLVLDIIEGADASMLPGLEVPLIATLPRAEQSLWDTHLPWPLAWVLGHEGHGIAPEVLALCDRAVSIPQPGGVESLNVAAAAAMCLYESARQRFVNAGPG